ncbi:MAG: D-alanine--D-alanine ligase [bacterium]
MGKIKLKNKKIAVIMGGSSGEREVSLRSGKKVFDSLKAQGFKVKSLDADKKLVDNLKKNGIDVAYIMLHGKFGEDGTIQGLLEHFGIPYTGSKILASALAMNKVAAKRIFKATGIPTPQYFPIDPDKSIKEQCEKIKRIFPLPLVVKPVSEGSSLGVTIVKEEEKLEKVISETAEKYKDVFVEEYIKGKEVTVGILGTGDDLAALPILELKPKAEFYDYKAKYTKGGTDFILPAKLPKDLYKHTQKIALRAHKALGCYGVSRVDIIISGDHTPYVHEVNTIPGMTDSSDLPAEAQCAGISFDELVVKILESAY